MEEKAKKPILVITYYWPPSGGAGVQRWLKFTKYLPEFGWQPIVFTPENPDFDQKDDSLLKDIHPDIDVLKFPIWEPYGLFKRLTGRKELKQGQVLETGKKSIFKNFAVWVRGNFFIPDPKIFWVKPSSEYLQNILETNEIKHVITTGPPHSVHLIGRNLKLKNPAIKWIADFRDPWSQWDILKRMRISKTVWRKHLKMEQEVLRMADSVLATGHTAAEEFKALGARKVHHITNGFDQDDLVATEPSQDTDKFLISHLGMLNKDRNPDSLWNVLDSLCEDEGFMQDLELRLIGILSKEVEQSIETRAKLNSCLKTKGYVDHNEVYDHYLSSNLLLLLQTRRDGSVSQLPGKLFEYLSARRPILAFGHQGSDVYRIIDETSSGKSFDYESEEELREFILKEYKAWKSKSSHWEFKNIDQYDRKYLTKELSTWLNLL